jgi:hypothetical protein
VKRVILLTLLFSAGVWAQERPVKAPCDSELLLKVREQGLRSLKLSEVLQYYKALKSCKNQTLAKRIRQYNESHQLSEDAENARTMQGFTSGCAYCTIALILYLILV